MFVGKGFLVGCLLLFNALVGFFEKTVIEFHLKCTLEVVRLSYLGQPVDQLQLFFTLL